MEARRDQGEAGRRGEDVRSDCWVSAELGGDPELELSSKVEALYGTSIRELVVRGLEVLDCDDASVAVEDQGAVPWVLQARLEAAIRAAGHEPRAPFLPEPAAGGTSGPTGRERLRRSRLYLPGNEPKFMLNAGLHEPDGVILDLEDSVHPAQKVAARYLVRNALRSVDFGGAERMVRINQLPLGLEDLDVVIPQRPDLILIPKVETADQVQVVHARIEGILEEHRLTGPVWLMPILESALGIENAFAIASATEAVAAVTVGLEDYTADMGVVKTPLGDESLWARSRLVNAARAAGVQAIDSVYGDVSDEEGLLAWGRRARAMGFVGMGCIHPRQIRVIHAAFSPSDQELERALRIVSAFEEAEARGLGVVSLGSKMIDRPVVQRARQLVELAREAGLVRDDETEVGSDDRAEEEA